MKPTHSDRQQESLIQQECTTSVQPLQPQPIQSKLTPLATIYPHELIKPEEFKQPIIGFCHPHCTHTFSTKESTTISSESPFRHHPNYYRPLSSSLSTLGKEKETNSISIKHYPILLPLHKQDTSCISTLECKNNTIYSSNTKEHTNM